MVIQTYKKTLRNITALTLCITALAMFSTTAQAVSLEETIAQTYQTNPTLKARQSRLEAVNESVSQAMGGFRPNVTFQNQFERRRSRQDLAPQKETRNLTENRLRITQNLYNGGGTMAAVETAQLDVAAERARLEQIERNAIYEGIRVHTETFYNDLIYTLRQENIERLKKQLQITQARNRVGEVTKTDLAQAEARLARASSDLVRAEGRRNASRAEYQQIVGIVPQNLDEPSIYLSLPTSLDDAINLATKQNPELRAAKFDYEATKSQIDVQTSTLLPTIDLVGEAAYFRNLSLEDTNTRRLSAFLEVNIPIYQNGRSSSRVRSAKKQASEARYALDETKRKVIENVRSSWNIYEAATAEITAVREEILVAKIALTGVEKEASVGQRTVSEILDAEQDLLAAQVSLATANRDSILAYYDLHSATGNLMAKQLNLNLNLYNPVEDYNKVKGKWWGLDIGKDLPEE